MLLIVCKRHVHKPHFYAKTKKAVMTDASPVSPVTMTEGTGGGDDVVTRSWAVDGTDPEIAVSANHIKK